MPPIPDFWGAVFWYQFSSDNLLEDYFPGGIYTVMNFPGENFTGNNVPMQCTWYFSGQFYVIYWYAIISLQESLEVITR